EADEAVGREAEAAAAARRAAAEEQSRQMAERRRARLAELVQDAEAAVAEADLAAARRRLGLARREWTDLTAGAEIEPALAARFSEAEARVAAREAETQEIEARARRDALHRLHQLLGRVEPLPAKPDLTLKAAERALRDVRTALAEIPPLPSK